MVQVEGGAQLRWKTDRDPRDAGAVLFVLVGETQGEVLQRQEDIFVALAGRVRSVVEDLKGEKKARN